MKVITIGCGIVFLLVVGAALILLIRRPLVFFAPAGMFPNVTCEQLPSGERSIRIRVSIENTDKPLTVVSIEMPRTVAEDLQLSPPEGFVIEPLPLTKAERNDPEILKFAEEFDAKTLRWGGSLLLAPDYDSVVEIPSEKPTGGAGTLTFSYERKVGLGGLSSGFDVEINTVPKKPTAVLGNGET